VSCARDLEAFSRGAYNDIRNRRGAHSGLCRGSRLLGFGRRIVNVPMPAASIFRCVAF
jgi:hypothetical protein